MEFVLYDIIEYSDFHNKHLLYVIEKNGFHQAILYKNDVRTFFNSIEECIAMLEYKMYKYEFTYSKNLVRKTIYTFSDKEQFIKTVPEYLV